MEYTEMQGSHFADCRLSAHLCIFSHVIAALAAVTHHEAANRPPGWSGGLDRRDKRADDVWGDVLRWRVLFCMCNRSALHTWLTYPSRL